MKKLLISFVLLFILGVGPARADLLIEPALGFHTSTFDPGGASYIGLAGGVKGAFTFAEIFFLGLDIHVLQGTLKTSSTSSDAMTIAYGPTFGVSLPAAPFRFWGTYLFSNQLAAKTSGSTTTYKGNGFRLGGGYMIIPMLLSLNLEYESANYDKYSDSTVTDASTNPNRKASSWVVTASIPIEL